MHRRISAVLETKYDPVPLAIAGAVLAADESTIRAGAEQLTTTDIWVVRCGSGGRQGAWRQLCGGPAIRSLRCCLILETGDGEWPS
jgi:hypothetical protein